MSSLFCCSSVQPYKQQRVSHEAKLNSFMNWARFPRSSTLYDGIERPMNLDSNWPYAVQLVQQVNYGALESTRYFVPKDQQSGGGGQEFYEISEKDLIEANYAKLNT